MSRIALKGLAFRTAAAAVCVAVAIAAPPALAHVEGASATHGFVRGFLHPFAGPDHLAAMVAVGLWGAVLGSPALWLLPILFPLVMAFGGLMGAAGIAVPQVETGIALSAIVLGMMVAGAVRAPLLVAVILVGTFAIFHGHAHGTELPRDAGMLPYSAGFVIATGLLHAAGIVLSLVGRWPVGRWLVRASGAAISLVGAGFLVARFAM